MREQRQQRAPKAADVGDHQRLGVAPELNPGELFGEFLEGPDPARQRHEGVGGLEHPLLADMHVWNDLKLAETAQRNLAVVEKARYNAARSAAFRQNGAR